MGVQVSAIMLGVEDLARSKAFYGEGLGCAIDQDYPNFVKFTLGDGSSSLALYETTGIRGSYIFVEAQRSVVDDFGGEGFDFTDTTWNVGLYFEL